MNRASVAFLIFVLTLLASCKATDGPTSLPDPDNPAENESPYFQYAGATYMGQTGTNGDSTAFVHSWEGIALSKPILRLITADGYFTIEGSIEAVEPAFALAMVKVQKAGSSSETTLYWVGGDFSQKIWLRFGPGDYLVQVLRAEITEGNLDYQGAIVAYTYWTPPAYEFEVTNTRDEDGRYLYPSYYSQSDDSGLQLLAAELTKNKTSDTEKARSIHDYLVMHLAYDFDSLDTGQRKKQDALTVYSNGLAVCDGYTTLYAALLRSIGMETAYCVGTAGGGSHAWNHVASDGDWRYVDVTWDDPILGADGRSDYPNGDNLRYDYFWKIDFADHALDEKLQSKTIHIGGSSLLPGWY